MQKEDTEKKIFYHSLVFPALYVLIIWLVKISEIVLNERFAQWGIYPMSWSGLRGILFAPLLHGDWDHLLANSPSFLVLSFFLFYFYRNVAYPVFFLIYFLSGFWLWFGGREAYHIGASSIIYGLAAFLFFGGFIRKYPRLMAISLIVVFLYGGMIWGVFPIWEEMSWEGHLFGAISGAVLAVVFRKKGPQRKQYIWNDEDVDALDNEDAYWKIKEVKPAEPKKKSWWRELFVWEDPFQRKDNDMTK